LESAAVPTLGASVERARQGEGVEDEGLKKNAIGFAFMRPVLAVRSDG
jgi:hypothetical protein